MKKRVPQRRDLLRIFYGELVFITVRVTGAEIENLMTLDIIVNNIKSEKLLIGFSENF